MAIEVEQNSNSSINSKGKEFQGNDAEIELINFNLIMSRRD